jgi:CheY-like chemotaxis protein/anti-sigma regulatory factor (Ser/Thr protein kinase)
MNPTVSPRVLVVDDSPTQALEVRQRLVRSGFSVQIASAGSEALEAVARDRPDIILTDLMMPEMNGFELASHIKRDYPGLPVVLMTAHGTEEIAMRALRDGAAGYVAKRNLARDLARTLENVLALIRASSARQQLMECFAESSACYLLANVTSLVPPLVGRLQRQLERTMLFNENVLLRVSMALREALVNAIEHGNLEVSSALRERDDDSYLEELRRRRELDPYRSRRVMLSARETRDSVTYVVRDEGPGYNVAALPDPTDPRNLEKCSGRGLLLIRTFMDEVSHNSSGNEITLIKRRAVTR